MAPRKKQPLITPEEVAKYHALDQQIKELSAERIELGKKFKQHVPPGVTFEVEGLEVLVTERQGSVDLAKAANAYTYLDYPEFYTPRLDVDTLAASVGSEVLEDLRGTPTLALSVKPAKKATKE